MFGHAIFWHIFQLNGETVANGHAEPSSNGAVVRNGQVKTEPPKSENMNVGLDAGDATSAAEPHVKTEANDNEKTQVVPPKPKRGRSKKVAMNGDSVDSSAAAAAAADANGAEKAVETSTAESNLKPKAKRGSRKKDTQTGETNNEATSRNDEKPPPKRARKNANDDVGATPAKKRATSATPRGKKAKAAKAEEDEVFKAYFTESEDEKEEKPPAVDPTEAKPATAPKSNEDIVKQALAKLKGGNTNNNNCESCDELPFSWLESDEEFDFVTKVVHSS